MFSGVEEHVIYLLAESLVVRDHTNYNLGPHTDKQNRLMSLLFYCPTRTNGRPENGRAWVLA